MISKLTASLVVVSILSACTGGESETGSVNGSPITPSNLTAVGANSSVTLTWSAVSNADSYIVNWSEAIGPSNDSIAVASGTTVTHDSVTAKGVGLTTGVVYSYTVAAVNTSGTSKISAAVNAQLKNKPWMMPLLNSIMGN